MAVGITLHALGERKFAIELYIIDDRSIIGDMLLGHDFVAGHKLILKYNLFEADSREQMSKINIFAVVTARVRDHARDACRYREKNADRFRIRKTNLSN